MSRPCDHGEELRSNERRDKSIFDQRWPDALQKCPDSTSFGPSARADLAKCGWRPISTTGQLRAVKIIATARSGTADPAGREITSIIRLEANLRRQHPNLVSIHHVGECPGHIFFVMDLADDLTGAPGSADPSYQPATLQSRLQAGPLSPEECWRRTGELLAGLAALHDAGMVHRDVKPANCLFVGGELKLADFGLLTEADRQMSRVGTRATCRLTAAWTQRADVYAAGLTIYEMITGLPPSCFPSLGEHAEKFADDPLLQRLNRLVLRACQVAIPMRGFKNAGKCLTNWPVPNRPKPSGCFDTGLDRHWCGMLAARHCFLDDRSMAESPRASAGQLHHGTVRGNHPARTACTLLKPDGTPYTTPCTVPDLPAGIHHVVFKREPSNDLDIGRIDFRDRRDIEARWNSEPKRHTTKPLAQ